MGFANGGENFDGDLSYVMFEVNGQRKAVQPGKTLQIVRGDQIRIVEAGLAGPKNLASRVNLVGFHSDEHSKLGNDINVLVKTDRSLLRGYAQGEQKNIYRVVASSGASDHGEVFIQVLKPELRFATVLVNDKERVIRDGQLLKLKADDRFKVKSVKTNVADQDQKVTFDVKSVAGIKQIQQVQFYTIEFRRLGRKFAQIPVQIEEL